MEIREIRRRTGLSQTDFGLYYNIHVSTIKKWEASKESKNHRECPVYVKQLLAKAVNVDFKKQKNAL